MPSPVPFSEQALREAIANSFCWADVLRALGYQVRGNNYRTVQRWAKTWEISSGHFDPERVRLNRGARTRTTPLAEILTTDSRYSRGNLKSRLFAEGLKERSCELCGQSELWRGRQMALILDHVNGVSDDNRLENLRIVCPNCNATLDTHCGRNLPKERQCIGCGSPFEPKNHLHRYCSQACWGKVASVNYSGVAHPETRKVERPSYDQLTRDVAEMSTVAVGRKYGVSDNAVRKWLRWYERQQERAAAGRREEQGVPPEDLAA